MMAWKYAERNFLRAGSEGGLQRCFPKPDCPSRTIRHSCFDKLSTNGREHLPPYAPLLRLPAGDGIFRYSFSFFPAELGLKQFATSCESDTVLRQASLLDLGTGFCCRLLQK